MVLYHEEYIDLMLIVLGLKSVAIFNMNSFYQLVTNRALLGMCFGCQDPNFKECGTPKFQFQML